MTREPDHVRIAREAARKDKPSRNGKPHRNGAPANSPETSPPPANSETASEQSVDPERIGTLLADVVSRPVEWLWRGRIPRGKLTILDGDPGLGKSTLTADLAARVSAGLPMPMEAEDQGSAPAGVVLLSAEDGLDDTIRPRLDAAGADVSRVLALETVPCRDGPRLPILPLDLRFVRMAIQRVAAALVIVDPIAAFLGGETNMHRDQDVRRALHPIARMAEETGAAVLVVRHLNKGMALNPLYRGGGSIGIIGAARSGLLLARDPENPDRRVLASTKCNLARLPSSLSFEMCPACNGSLQIGWIGESPHGAESLLAATADPEERDASQAAAEVLRAILADGMRPAEDVKRQARQAGVSDRTLQRAKTALGVRTKRIGYGNSGKWHWYLPNHAPTDETAKTANP